MINKMIKKLATLFNGQDPAPDNELPTHEENLKLAHNLANLMQKQGYQVKIELMKGNRFDFIVRVTKDHIMQFFMTSVENMDSAIKKHQGLELNDNQAVKEAEALISKVMKENGKK